MKLTLSQANEHLRHYDSLYSIRQTMQDELDEIEQYIDPIRGGKFFSPQTSQHETEWNRAEVYDGTARKSLIDLAANMASYLTSASLKWFELSFRNQALNTEQEAKVWLEECGKRIWQALNDSNFSGEMAKFYLDLCAYGTAFNIEEVENELDYKGINFSTIPIREAYFEPDHAGLLNKFYRRLQWHPLQIMTKFGEENTPASIVAEAMKGDLDTKHDVIFVIYEREKYKEISDDVPHVDPMDRRWGWAYILHDDAYVFTEGGYYEMAAHAVKWEEASGNDWGFGPGHIALPSVKSVNEMRKLMKERAAKEVDPILATTKNNIVGDVNWRSGSVHTFKNLEDMKYLSPESNFSIAVDDLERDQMFIRQVFFNDDLFLKDSPQMTATEVMERTERLIKLLGGTFGRLVATLLDPTIQRTFNILWRAGELPPMPKSVEEEAQNADDVLDINYTGALARSQKQEEVIAAERFLQGLMMQAEIKPEVLDLFNFDKYNRGQADKGGVPADYLMSDKDVKATRDRRAQQQEQAQQAQLAQETGAGMQAMGEGQQALKAVE
jgi:hypothetical protein